MAAATDGRDRDRYGFVVDCGHRIGDGALCELKMFVQWIASESRGKHFELDGETPHVHRDGTPWKYTR